MNLFQLEKFLKNRVLSDLKNGRPGFDLLHTQEVVVWVKRILRHEKKLTVDKPTLIIAAYAHDWGYVGMFGGKKTLAIQKVIDAKAAHMQRGAERLRKLLVDPFFSFLTKTKKDRCVHLVAVHDKLSMLKDVDELILMEADTLSGLDVATEKSHFDAVSNEKFVTAVKETRVPLFITTFGKQEASRLLSARRRFYTKP